MNDSLPKKLVGKRKDHILVIVSYESGGGGMGEHDAIEEGLRALLQHQQNPTVFDVEVLTHITPVTKHLIRKMVDE